MFSLVASLGFHSAWIVALSFCGYSVDYNLLFALLTEGQANGRFEPIDDWLVIKVTAYLVSQCAGAWVAGSMLASVAEGVGWNRRLALSSNGAVWHRLLRFPSEAGDRFEGPILTATYSENNRTFLYRGALAEYQLDQGGKLVRLVLEGALWREFPECISELKDPDDFENWHVLEGERFVINCEQVNQIEVDYVWLEPREPEPEVPVPEEADFWM